MITWRVPAAVGGLGVTTLWWLPAPFIVLGGILGVVAVLTLLDLLIAAPADEVRLRRDGPVKVRLGDTVTLTLAITNTSVRTMRALVRDAWVPSAGAGDPYAHAVTIDPDEAVVLETELTPNRRGDRRAVRVTIRSYGPLGLAFRQTSRRRAEAITPPWTLRTLPEFRSRKLLPEKLSRLRVIDGQVVTRSRGQGAEFDSLRDYVIGDDPRAIDWRGSARHDHLVVKQWRPERDRRVLCVIDTGRTSAGRVAPPVDVATGAAHGTAAHGTAAHGTAAHGTAAQGTARAQGPAPAQGTARAQGPAPAQGTARAQGTAPARRMAESMPCAAALAAAESGGEPRLDYAIDAALLLASLAAHAGDRVDLLALDTRTHASVSTSSKRSLPKLIEALAPLEPALVETDFGRVVSEVLALERKRALVVIFTTLDPCALGEGLLPVLPSLISRHTVVVAAVHDPALDALATARGSVASLHTAAAAERGLAELARVKAALTRYGVHVIDAPAQSFASEVADTYLNLKAAGRL
jgi:uncharacterized protein (DUF58 family)